MRLVQIIQLPDFPQTGRSVKIRKNVETAEYICQLHENGKHYEPADYFTSDYVDALGTARLMCQPVTVKETQ
jgi:hypothetical protein